MALKDTIKNLKTLLVGVASDLDKSDGGNKAASQRVRTGTIHLEKVAKLYRRESIQAEKSGSFKKRPKAAAKKASKPQSKAPAKASKAKKAPSKAVSKSKPKAKPAAKRQATAKILKKSK